LLELEYFSKAKKFYLMFGILKFYRLRRAPAGFTRVGPKQKIRNNAVSGNHCAGKADEKSV